MPYKNSDGNSSIANEWGQWRYFNSALKKLGNSTPAPVSITPKSPVVEKEINWMNVAGDVIKGAMGVFEARRDLSYSIADDYMKKHSLKEYQQAMQTGSIPFQDDPLAMQRLKYDHGKLVFQMSEQDFNERVNKGEFVGMEPEQVDALHYEHSKKSMKEVADVFGYADGNDYWFNEGFFEDSEANRIKSLLRNSEVTNDTLIQQRLTNDISKVVAMINSGEVAPDAIANIIAETYTQSGYRYTPKDLAVLSKSILEAVGKSPYGDKVLNAIENAEVPGTGVTFKEYIGEAGIGAVKQASANLRYNIDAKSMYDFKEKVDNLARNGDHATLGTMLAEEIKANGNTKTERTEYLYKGVEAAKKAQEKALGTEQNRAIFEHASRDWAEYLLRKVNGEEGLPTIADKKVEYKGSGFTTTHMDQVAQQVIAKVFNENDPVKLNSLFSYAVATKDTYPELRRFVLNAFKDKARAFDDTLNAYIEKGAVDSTKEKVSDYVYKPIGSSVEVRIPNVPTSLQAIMQMYHINPSAFSAIATDGLVKKMNTAEMACILGLNPMKVIGDSERFNAEYARNAKANRSPDRTPPPLKHDLIGNDELGLDLGSANALDIIAYAEASEFIRTSPNKVSLKDAMDAGRELVRRNFYKVGRFAVPKVSLERSFKNLTSNEAKMTDIGELAEKTFNNYSKEIGDTSLSYYDASDDAIVIVDRNGIQNGKLSMEEFSSMVYKEYNEDQKRRSESFFGKFF